MCGIVGYTGHVQAAPILLDGRFVLEGTQILNEPLGDIHTRV